MDLERRGGNYLVFTLETAYNIGLKVQVENVIYGVNLSQVALTFLS